MINKISFKGVLLGILTTFLLDTICGGILFTITNMDKFTSQMSDKDLSEAFEIDNVFFFWSVIIGTLTTILGGYVSASIAKKSAYINSGIIGFIGIIIGITSLVFDEPNPLWFDIIGFITVVPAALLGGYFAIKRNKSTA